MLPPYATRDIVRERLPLVFPLGSPQREFLVRDTTAATVFAALYIGAVDGSQARLGPKHVYCMTQEQAEEDSDAARVAYREQVLQPGFKPVGHRWYHDNTREPIRDEALRQGLLPVGACKLDQAVPTTSPRPRYYLEARFAALFDPSLSEKDVATAVEAWRKTHLQPGQLARIRLVSSGVEAVTNHVLVTLPNQEVRALSPGLSSKITKSVVEQFAQRFLERPAVIWISESGNKVIQRDDALAKKLELDINPARVLPDVILVDLRRSSDQQPLLVFVEVVATDGAVTEQRREQLLDLARSSVFPESQVAFITAFEDRSKMLPRFTANLAWGSFAWYASEPDGLLGFHGSASSDASLHALLRLASK